MAWWVESRGIKIVVRMAEQDCAIADLARTPVRAYGHRTGGFCVPPLSSGAKQATASDVFQPEFERHDIVADLDCVRWMRQLLWLSCSNRSGLIQPGDRSLDPARQDGFTTDERADQQVRVRQPLSGAGEFAERPGPPRRPGPRAARPGSLSGVMGRGRTSSDPRLNERPVLGHCRRTHQVSRFVSARISDYLPKWQLAKGQFTQSAILGKWRSSIGRDGSQTVENLGHFASTGSP